MSLDIEMAEEEIWDVDALKAVRVFFDEHTKMPVLRYLISWVGFDEYWDEWKVKEDFGDQEQVINLHNIMPATFDKTKIGMVWHAPVDWIEQEKKAYYEENAEVLEKAQGARFQAIKERIEKNELLSASSEGRKPFTPPIHETQIEENNAKYQKYLRKQRAQQKKTGTRLPTSSTWFSGQPSQAVMQSPALSTPWKDLTSSDHPQSLDRMTAHISMDTTPEFWGNSMREPQSVEIGRPRVFESSHIDNSESTYESNGYDLTGQVNVQDINPKFKGNYSSVFQGTVGDELVAVKVIQSRATPPTVHRRILRERTVWTLMKHPNILPFYGYTEGSTIGQLNTPFGALISPWYENGDASKFMEEHGVRLSKDARTALWKGVIDGVAYLHQHQPAIVHGDLKPGNVIIDDSGCPRICDFGLAQIFYDEADSGMTTTTEHTGTDRYLAPELLVDEVNTRPTAASDVYAVGCLGLELVFLKKPYSHRKNNLRGFIHTDIKKGIPPAVDCDTQSSLTWSMIKSCWDRQPEARPSASRMAEVLSTTLIHTTEP